jgi:secondary thiamine-phosphate synthase enzyme
LKAIATGSSQTVLIEGGRLLLGRWQGLYFCEYDGPRERRYLMKIMQEQPT